MHGELTSSAELAAIRIRTQSASFNYCTIFLSLSRIYLYCRITPAYGISILIYSTFWWYVWDGPLHTYTTPGQFDGPCANHWWTNLLYINNIVLDTSQVIHHQQALIPATQNPEPGLRKSSMYSEVP